MRAFGALLVVAGLAGGGVAPSTCAATHGDTPMLVAVASRDAPRVALLECRSGRPVATAIVPSPLAADPAFAPDGQSLYVLGRAHLLRYALPGLRELARAELDFPPLALAAAGGDDAVVLVGGRGSSALSAHDPLTLAEIRRYRLEDERTVSAIRDTPERHRFVVAFADLAEAWEIAYDRDAPPVLQGLVHDYRSGEAVPLPGRFTPRRFALPGATRALVAGPVPAELARLDQSGALAIVHLEVRREIERPPISATRLAPDRVAAWRGATRRGWLIADEGASEAEVLEAGTWKVSGRIAAGGEILAMTPADGRVLVAQRRADGVAVSLLDVSRGATAPLVERLEAAQLPVRFTAGTGGCFALIDRDGRWLAGFAVPPLR